MKKIIKFSIAFIGFLVVILLIMVKWIPRPPFTETDHYKKWQNEIAAINFKESDGSISVGWALENITPDSSAPLAGYGKRRGKHFDAVNDSIYVRTILVQDSIQKVYFVSTDLLFVPPKVVIKVEEKLKGTDITLKDIHFSAVHSHSSIGGWENTLTGELFGGKYDPKIVDMLADKITKSLLMAKNNLSPAKIYYSEVVDSLDVRYRLKIPNGVKDTEIRSLSFVKNNGEKAHLITYSAHNTVLSDKITNLSRDYSGALVDSLKPDFGMYMSGSVASMGPVEIGVTEYDELEHEASGILGFFRIRQDKLLTASIVSDFIKVPMPEPSARIAKNWALRPWVFKKFFGDYPTYIKVTKIGNCVILGMPADFSGEIMVELDKYAKAKGIDLIITSFNGGYIGYITADKIYDSGVYETLTMSWYGYQIGGYFEQISKDIIDKLSEKK